ncbi:MAG: 2-oxo acid dehydrogenase subunit E2 [Alphaproteobacteria bacterium]|nr:2-oxo acid dehydrogenase subunit E2 [Alphaproteobacteria bacterium]
MKTFHLPDIGEGLHEAQVVHWHVAVGDRVGADQPLVAVETDKAVVEVPAPWAGRILRLHVGEGQQVVVGAPLVDIETEAVAGEDAGTVVGRLEPASPAAIVALARATAVRAAPAVRALAAKLGVDLAACVGSGPEDSITRADVAAAAALSAALPEGWEALAGVRRSMARNMARAGAEVVPATVHDEADVEGWPAEPEVTLRLVAAIAAAVAAEPALNASFDGQRLAWRRNAKVDVRIAVDTVDGLIVPVLRDCAAADQATLRQRLAAAVSAVRERRAGPEDLRGPSITLSNFGGIAGRHAALVVVPPQVAIVGAGRIAPCARVTARGLEARRTLPLSLTFDHRAISGAEAARFLRALIAALEQTT